MAFNSAPPNQQRVRDLGGIPKIGDSRHQSDMLFNCATIPKRWQPEDAI